MAKKKHSPRLKRLPPTSPSARDEGPRLLPLGDRGAEPSKLDHYLDLADAALGLKDEKDGQRRGDPGKPL